jgi:hypothetical protein
MFKKEKIKPENSLLQPHKETTLEKNQKMRERRKAMIAKQFNKFQKDIA